MSYTVSQIASKLNAQLLGEGKAVVTGVNALEAAGESQITFLSSQKHEAKLADCRACAVIVANPVANSALPQLVVANVDAALIAALNILAPSLQPVQPGVHPTAVIESGAKIDPTASIGPGAHVGVNAAIGANTIISARCSIGENSVIGSNCRLDPNVVVYHNCRIGNYVIIQANTTIGSVGFGYAYFDGKHNLIPHNGGVIIEDFVEIGANCCVDRAKFGNTVVGAGTKIDNLVQIAHNVTIGKCCLLVAQVGIAGSSVLGNGVVLGGQVGVSDHANIGDGTMVAARSGVIGDLPAGQKVGGTPPVDVREAIRIAMATQRLPDLVKQVKELSQKVKLLEAAKDNTK